MNLCPVKKKKNGVVFLTAYHYNGTFQAFSFYHSLYCNSLVSNKCLLMSITEIFLATSSLICQGHAVFPLCLTVFVSHTPSSRLCSPHTPSCNRLIAPPCLHTYHHQFISFAVLRIFTHPVTDC